MGPKKSSAAAAMAAMALAPPMSAERQELLKKHRNEVLLFERSERVKLHSVSGAAKIEVQKELAAEKEEIIKRHEAELAALGDEQPPAPAVEEEEAADEPAAAGGKKKSKAARRRENKEAQEEARRVAAEEVMKGFINPKDVENEALSFKLNPLKLAVHEVSADGNCMFRAISHQIDLLGREAMPYDSIRKLAASHMSSHRPDFEPFVELHEGMDPAAKHGGVFESYIYSLANTACWGGHVELQALSDALKLHIIVIGANMDNIEFGNQYPDTIRLSFHKAAYALGEHYNSLVPAA